VNIQDLLSYECHRPEDVHDPDASAFRNQFGAILSAALLLSPQSHVRELKVALVV